MATNVLVNSVDALQKKYQKSITDISPNASNADLKTFVQGLNALTDNTITGIRRVEVTDILNGEDDTDTRLDRNLNLYDEINDEQHTTPITTLSHATIGTDLVGGGVFIAIIFDGTADLSDLTVTRSDVTGGGYGYLLIDWYPQDNHIEVAMIKTSDSTPYTGTLTFTLAGNDTYKPATATLTITA